MVCLPPPPCLPHPSVVAPGQSCSCNLTGLTLSPQICQEAQLCHTACISPVYCADPTTEEDWDSRNALVRSGLTNTDSFIQWSTLEVDCKKEAVTTEGEVSFRAMCGEAGTWNMSTCFFPLCTEVKVDNETVEVTEDTIQGRILKKFSCKDEAEVFNVGSGLTRIQAVCNRR